MADTLIQGTTIIEDKRSERSEVWSISGKGFFAANPDTDQVTYADSDGTITIQENGKTIFASVNLPHGVTVKAVIVEGSISDETWTLLRAIRTDGVATIMATANIDTEDTSITNNIIDNLTFTYFLQTSTLDSADTIFGARIIYEF